MKRLLSYVLGVSMLGLQASTPEIEQKHLTYIRSELKKYRLNAPWIIDELRCLKVEQFDNIWHEIMEIFTESERRWFYFCDRQEDYSEEAYWKYALAQCELYESWLSKLCVNVKNLELIEFNPKNMSQDNLTTIYAYWDWKAKVQGSEKKYHSFYSYYFDCITHAFNESINNAKEEINNSEVFKQFFIHASRCLIALERCLEKLRESKQFAHYLLAYQSLKQIYGLLDQEKKMGTEQ